MIGSQENLFVVSKSVYQHIGLFGDYFVTFEIHLSNPPKKLSIS